jgi:LacI family transcriptional regulator, gluconate utilization system Gnt-I transcriptional repressor
MSRRRAPTMRDIGQKAGVAPITVSRALRGDAGVHVDTRAAVIRAANRLGYVHNNAARALSARGSKLVALIVPNISNSVFAETIDGLTDALVAHGYSLIIGYSGYSKDGEERLIRSLLGHQPEAMILTGFIHTPTSRNLLRRAAIPIVEIWNIGPKPIDMAVGFSNLQAATEMTRYLIERGHHRLAYAGGTQTDNDRTQARELGFRKALAEARLAVNDAWIVSLPMEFASGCELARNLMTQRERPTAIFAASDIIATGFVLECQRLGVHVPDDIAVAGFDDAPLSATIEPQLTTVQVPQRKIGVVAGEMILHRLRKGRDRARQRDLGFNIIQRGSV